MGFCAGAARMRPGVLDRPGRPGREGLVVRSPLESRIGALRGRVRRLLALHGLSRVVGALLLGIILAGLADWLVPGHLAPEVRLVALFGLIGLVVRLGWRYVIAPLVLRFRDL